MLSKIIFSLLAAFTLATVVAGQAKKVDDRSLPDQLSESEVQSILKQTSPKSHVEAALKVCDLRLANALKSVQANQYNAAVQDVDVFTSLIIYADGYTRKLPDAQIKDRNHCLKKIEQIIFKNTRNLDFIAREVPFDSRESVQSKIAEVKKVRLRAVDDLLGGGKTITPSGGAPNEK